jgi:hypothetical protein
MAAATTHPKTYKTGMSGTQNKQGLFVCRKIKPTQKTHQNSTEFFSHMI